MIYIFFAIAMLITWYYLKYSPVRYHKKVIGKYPLPKKEVIKAKLTATPTEILTEKEWKTYIKNERNSPTNSH